MERPGSLIKLLVSSYVDIEMERCVGFTFCDVSLKSGEAGLYQGAWKDTSKLSPTLIIETGRLLTVAMQGLEGNLCDPKATREANKCKYRRRLEREEVHDYSSQNSPSQETTNGVA